jgi:hypothetical protein
LRSFHATDHSHGNFGDHFFSHSPPKHPAQYSSIFFGVEGASCLLGRCSTTWVTLQPALLFTEEKAQSDHLAWWMSLCSRSSYLYPDWSLHLSHSLFPMHTRESRVKIKSVTYFIERGM